MTYNLISKAKRKLSMPKLVEYRPESPYLSRKLRRVPLVALVRMRRRQHKHLRLL